MLCSRSASLTSSTRTSSEIASSSLRRFSACSAFFETRSSFFSLVRPSTSLPISGPNSSSISSRVAVGVLDRVVQQRDRDRRLVEMHVGQDRGDFERMREIGIAGGALLLAMLLHGIDIGLVEQRLVDVRLVALDPLDKLVLTHHAAAFLSGASSAVPGDVDGRPAAASGSAGSRSLTTGISRGYWPAPDDRKVNRRRTRRMGAKKPGRAGLSQSAGCAASVLSSLFSGGTRPSMPRSRSSSVMRSKATSSSSRCRSAGGGAAAVSGRSAARSRLPARRPRHASAASGSGLP